MRQVYIYIYVCLLMFVCVCLYDEFFIFNVFQNVLLKEKQTPKKKIEK